MHIIELADVVHVPILKAGNHRSQNAGIISITPEGLEDIFNASMECKPLIQESIKTGSYRGNDYDLKKPIPGPINFHHDAIFDDTIRDRVKAVDWEFSLEEIGGETWLTESFFNVPQDVARSMQTHFPGRSVELIPLTNPDTGNVHDRVIRSTAFLDHHTAPAVKGQDLDVTVNFSLQEAEHLVTTIITLEEETSMSNQNEKERNPEEEIETSEEDEEKEDKDEKIAQLQAELEKHKTEGSKIAELEAARKESAQKIAELQAVQEQAELATYMQTLENGHYANEKGIQYQVTPAFRDLVSPYISGSSKTDMIELAEGKTSSRDGIQDLIKKIVDYAVNDRVVVCLSEIAPMKYADPAKTQVKTRQEAIVEFQTTHPDMSYPEALRRASTDPKNKELFTI